MKNIKRTFATLFVAVFGSALVMNCEPDVDSLGEQLFTDEAAQGNETSLDIIAFNIDNKDSIQSDASKIDSGAVIGAFAENHFGMQKASYFTQLRLSAYNPDFGTNPVVDSVVLVVKPTYSADSITTTTDVDYVYPEGSVPAKLEVKKYPVKKYGKANTAKMTLKVHEVLDFLNGPLDYATSNTNFAINSQELGSFDFDGTVKSVSITKDSDESSLFSSDAGIRIPLSASFFQNKIIAMQGKPELKDAANFIRHFKGLKLSVVENDGYLMRFTPDNVNLIMYFKNDVTDNGTTTRAPREYAFSMGAANAHIGHYEYNRAGTAVASALASSSSTTGDAKLYAQGMGGPSIGIKFPAETINHLKSLYQTNKAAIISAKIRMYTDSSWKDKNFKPNSFTIIQRDLVDNKEAYGYTSDVTKLSGATAFKIYKSYNLDQDTSYYDFTVTQSVKDLVEGNVDYTNKYLKIDLARFQVNANTFALLGYNKTSRSYSTARGVFVGSNTSDANKIKLRVTYGTK